MAAAVGQVSQFRGGAAVRSHATVGKARVSSARFPAESPHFFGMRTTKGTSCPLWLIELHGHGGFPLGIEERHGHNLRGYVLSHGFNGDFHLQTRAQLRMIGGNAAQSDHFL